MGWKAWLTEPNKTNAQKSQIRVQDYAWYDLAKGPYRIEFESDGQYNRYNFIKSLLCFFFARCFFFFGLLVVFVIRWYMKITVSGVEKDGSFVATLDGESLEWNTHGNLDRGFHTWSRDEGFSKGKHILEFSQVLFSLSLQYKL